MLQTALQPDLDFLRAVLTPEVLPTQPCLLFFVVFFSGAAAALWPKDFPLLPTSVALTQFLKDLTLS